MTNIVETFCASKKRENPNITEDELVSAIEAACQSGEINRKKLEKELLNHAINEALKEDRAKGLVDIPFLVQRSIDRVYFTVEVPAATAEDAQEKSFVIPFSRWKATVDYKEEVNSLEDVFNSCDDIRTEMKT